MGLRLLEFFRPFRAIVTRRVTEEEQLTVEMFYHTEAQAEAGLSRFLGVCRDHRKRTNDEVVNLTRQQLLGLETAIENRGETIRGMDAEIERKREEVKKLDAKLAHKSRALDLKESAPIPSIPRRLDGA